MSGRDKEGPLPCPWRATPPEQDWEEQAAPLEQELRPPPRNPSDQDLGPLWAAASLSSPLTDRSRRLECLYASFEGFYRQREDTDLLGTLVLFAVAVMTMPRLVTRLLLLLRIFGGHLVRHAVGPHREDLVISQRPEANKKQINEEGEMEKPSDTARDALIQVDVQQPVWVIVGLRPLALMVGKLRPLREVDGRADLVHHRDFILVLLFRGGSTLPLLALFATELARGFAGRALLLLGSVHHQVFVRRLQTCEANATLRT